jgi:hypothetical protein
MLSLADGLCDAPLLDCFINFAISRPAGFCTGHGQPPFRTVWRSWFRELMDPPFPLVAIGKRPFSSDFSSAVHVNNGFGDRKATGLLYCMRRVDEQLVWELGSVSVCVWDSRDSLSNLLAPTVSAQHRGKMCSIYPLT